MYVLFQKLSGVLNGLANFVLFWVLMERRKFEKNTGKKKYRKIILKGAIERELRGQCLHIYPIVKVDFSW